MLCRGADTTLEAFEAYDYVGAPFLPVESEQERVRMQATSRGLHGPVGGLVPHSGFPWRTLPFRP
jgi:hypothetical protein